MRKFYKYLVALCLPAFFLFGLSIIEVKISDNKNCEAKQWLFCHLKNLELVDSIESYSILVVAILFIWEAGDRKRQLLYQAGQALDSAKGTETSYARVLALQDLHEHGGSLKGLDAEDTDLEEIHLERANLQGANLQRANLQRANLQEASLQEASLQEASLQGVNLQGANLRFAELQGANLQGANLRDTELGSAQLHKTRLEDVNLQGANLRGANLRDAKLGSADLQGTELQGAKLQGASLEDIKLKDANIRLADFCGVENLRIEEVKQAKNWKTAFYDRELCQQLDLDLEKNKELKRQANLPSKTAVECTDQNSKLSQLNLLISELLANELIQDLISSNENLISKSRSNSLEIVEIKQQIKKINNCLSQYDFLSQDSIEEIQIKLRELEKILS